MIERVKKELDKIVQEFKDKHLSLGMKASGKWIESLEVEVIEVDGIIKANIKANDYTKYLTKGRPNGKRPPITPIKDWVRNKFGISGKQGLSIAFAVAKKIEKSGTTWHQKGGSDLIDGVLTKSRIEELESAIQTVIIEKISSDIKRKLKEVA